MGIVEGIYTEIYSLGYACLCGAGLAFLYDLLRIARRVVPRGNILVSMEDIIYFTFSTLAIFSFFYVVNYGEIRFFLVAGLTIGASIYHLLIGKWLMRLVTRFILRLKKELKKRKKEVTIELEKRMK